MTISVRNQATAFATTLATALVGATLFASAAQAGSFASSGAGPQRVKTCTNTYHPGGRRCTTCTYSNSGHTTVKCIKIKKPKPSASHSGNQSLRVQ